MTQWLIVVLVVAGCFSYATWTLLPATGRRWLARHLAAWPLPASAIAKLRRQAESSGGCGCDGCEKSILTRAKASRRRPVAPAGPHARREP